MKTLSVASPATPVFRQRLRAAGVLLALLTCAGPVARGALLIDGFTTEQSVSVSGGPTGYQANFGAVAAPEALGGERDVFVERTSNNRGPVSLDVSGSIAGALAYNSGIRTTGGATVTWDGFDNSAAVNFTGLNRRDLTQDGQNNALLVSRTSDLGASVLFTIYQDETHFSTATMPVPADAAFQFSIAVLPFGSFTPAGPDGGANFKCVGAIVMTILGSAGADVGIGGLAAASDSLVAVPEAATWLAGFGALGMLGHLFLSRRTVRA